MKKEQIHTHEAGLTFVEVLAALIMVSVVSLYLLSFFTMGSAYSAGAVQRLGAQQLARLTLNHVQTLDFETQVVPLANGMMHRVDAEKVIPFGIPIELNPQTYTIQMRVYPDMSLQPRVREQLYFVEVIVLWQDGQLSLTGSVKR